MRLARATLLLIDADNDADAAVLQAMSTLAVSGGLAPAGVPTLVQAPHLFERALLAGLADADRAPAASPTTCRRWSARRRRCANGCRPSNGG